jgi:hypothetical protein
MFGKNEIDEYLMALDSELDFAFEVIVIGGAAATVFYRTKEGTEDIDTFNNLSRLHEAKERLRGRGLAIPFHEASVKFGPYNFRDRLTYYDELNLKWLRIQVPEIHDLILFKVTRLEEKDLTDIINLAKAATINPEILFQRFTVETLPDYAGSESMACCQYLEMLDKLFGDDLASAHQARLEAMGLRVY